MTSFIIKIIACITMVLDHIKYAIPETECFLTTYFGRFAFPLFAFLLVEGYSHTSDLKKYYKRLFIGEKIKEARVKKGYSQQQLSDKLELMAVYTCRGSVSRIENGKRAVTDIEIDAISKVLDCSLDFLFDRE